MKRKARLRDWDFIYLISELKIKQVLNGVLYKAENGIQNFRKNPTDAFVSEKQCIKTEFSFQIAYHSNFQDFQKYIGFLVLYYTAAPSDHRGIEQNRASFERKPTRPRQYLGHLL